VGTRVHRFGRKDRNFGTFSRFRLIQEQLVSFPDVPDRFHPKARWQRRALQPHAFWVHGRPGGAPPPARAPRAASSASSNFTFPLEIRLMHDTTYH